MNQPPKKNFSSYAGSLAVAGTVIILLSLVYLFLCPKSYTASARIKVADWSNGNKPVNPSDTRYIAEECSLLRSNSVIDDVISNLDLLKIWGQKSSPPRTLTLAEARDRFARQIVIHPVPDLSLIEIRAISSVQSEPALIANELARDYFVRRLEHHRAVFHYQTDLLEKDFQDRDQAVHQAQTNVDFLFQTLTHQRATNQTKYYEPESYELLVRKKIDLESRFFQQQDELARLRGMSHEDRKQALSTVETNSILMPVLLQLSIARNKLFAARLDHGPDAPEVTLAASHVEQLLRKSDELTTNIMEAREMSLNALKASLDNWTSRLRNASTNLAEAIAGDKDYNAALAGLKKAREEREDAQFKIDVVRMNEKLLPASEGVTAEIIDRAEPPVSPRIPDQFLGVCAISVGVFLLLLAMTARISKPKKISPGTSS